MVRVDKDGSGSVDRTEFTGLMAEILSKRNLEEEIRKVFRCYDNDDDGEISKKNIMECADVLDLSESMNEENV
jgi:Ca2+-binding EF-hand superfamily protein